MDVKFAYLGRSSFQRAATGDQLRLLPNLAREPVSFDAPLLQPVRFREAISALHDVVINDLRYQPRDHTAYQEWKKSEAEREGAFRRQMYEQVKQEILAKRETPVPVDLESRYRACRGKYWNARQEYSNYLRLHDMDLWRKLMPCDPIVTVADDVLFFECFSADESSYGCLTVDREGTFGRSETLQLGTTNVDYSWDLYHHFQALRTYRETRFRVDPQGFEVAVASRPDYREEKIDLPQGWLRGLMQVQVAMGMPTRRVSLSREAAYSLLAWLKRHRARKSPRAIRFELLAGKSPRMILEPWEQPIESLGTRYDGPNSEPVRVWGGRRLLVLARILPLLDGLDVYLLGTGLPSFWVARMGAMRLTLGLSGWTTNDWTHGSALDLLAPPVAITADVVQRVTDGMRRRRLATLDDIVRETQVSVAQCAAALHRLANAGQLIYDLAGHSYRWRQIMPTALGEAELGPENAEAVAAKEIVSRRRVAVESDERPTEGLRLLKAKVENQPVELLLDADGTIKRGHCLCGHHRRAGLRMGPCRHLLALRAIASPAADSPATLESWFEKLRKWSNN